MAAPVAREGYLHENYHYFHLRDTAGQERDFHFHEFCKVVLLLSGRVDYLLEGSSYRLRPWDVLLVNHHTIHKAVIDQSQTYDRVILYLDGGYAERVMPGAGLMNCFAQADRQTSHLLSPGPEQRRQLQGLVEALDRSGSDRGFGAQALRDTLVIQLLVHLNRMTAEALPYHPPERAHDPKVAAALSYINEHLAEELTVEALAEGVYLSKYHFMRLFRADTGSTVHGYIRQKRLMYASRLIREGVPANKAAVDSGFADYSSFHRAFRELFGISPGQLKKR